MAEIKRSWVGAEGRFLKRDLIAWYRVYNQTKINNARPKLKKIQTNFDLRAAFDDSLVNANMAANYGGEDKKGDVHYGPSGD